MDDINYYDLIEYWYLTIKQKMIDGSFQSVPHQATIKWFNNTYFEGSIIQQQSSASFKVLAGYASNGPFNIGTITFDVTADDHSVRNFHGDIIDEWSIFGSCTSKGINKHDNAKARWNAFRYKKIHQEVEEEDEEDESDLVCPYCNSKSSEGCEHVIAYTDPDCFILDLKYPLMPKTCVNFEWPEEILCKIFGNIRDILKAYGDADEDTIELTEKPDIIRYFEELMEKITCDFETRYHEFSGGPGSSVCGYYYFAENPREVHKQLKKIIRRLERGFKKLEDKINKEHMGCPYCGVDYKKTKCMHYVTHTDLVNYPRLPEKLKDKKWLQENLRKTFGELYDLLDAYEHGLTKEPNRIVYLKKLLEKLGHCEFKYYEQKESLVVFANEKEPVLEKLSELEKMLAWLFRGLAYAENMKAKKEKKT